MFEKRGAHRLFFLLIFFTKRMRAWSSKIDCHKVGVEAFGFFARVSFKKI